jgi:DNA-directed RNA polymerase subunit RPC12/RpoP
MPSLHFDGASLSALRAWRALKALAFVALGIYFALDLIQKWWELPLPGWSRFAMLCTAAVLGLCAYYMSLRVRCPHCSHPALESFAPSWRKLRPIERNDEIRCEYCQEVTCLSGGTSPPSNISLQRDRVG